MSLLCVVFSSFPSNFASLLSHLLSSLSLPFFVPLRSEVANLDDMRAELASLQALLQSQSSEIAALEVRSSCLGHLRYRLTDVPPQPNSLSGGRGGG